MAGNSKSKRKSAGTRKQMCSVTPLTIGITHDQKLRLKMMPYNALQAFREGTATRTNFTTIYLRLSQGVHLLKDVLKIDVTKNDFVETLVASLEMARTIMQACTSTTPEEWTATAHQIALLDEGLNIVDQLQDQTTRRELAFAMRESHKAFNYEELKVADKSNAPAAIIVL